MDKFRAWLRSISLLVIFGTGVTAFYFGYLIEVYGNRLHYLKEMPLNEVGDFLAGVFGTVAFLWLVIGYLMQNKELQNNTLESKKAHDLAINQLNFQKQIKNYELIKEHNKNQPFFGISTNLNFNPSEKTQPERTLNAKIKSAFEIEIEICNYGSEITNVIAGSLFRMKSIKRINHLSSQQHDYFNKIDKNEIFKITFPFSKELLSDIDTSIVHQGISEFYLHFNDGLGIRREMIFTIYISDLKPNLSFDIKFNNTTKTLPEVTL